MAPWGFSMSVTGSIFNSRYLFLLLAGALSFVPVVHAADNDRQSPAPIIGGGAHFSWVVFHELQPGLEKLLDRDIELYGKDSALGLGCNAGIKNAMQNAPDHETFGFVCCELSEKEIREKKLQLHPLAHEPVLILVNQSNPIENLSIDRKSTRLNSSHTDISRMPSSA